MAGPRRKGSRNQQVTVVRRPPGEPRKGLPEDALALAEGRATRLSRPRRTPPRLRDPRLVFLVPGVANRDARRVWDARIAELRGAAERAGDLTDAIAQGDLGHALSEAIALGLWRAGSLTSFEALCEQVLELDARRARALVAASDEPRTMRFDDETVAVWMRAEAALLEAGLAGALHAVDTDQGAALVLELPSREAAESLVVIGRRQTQIAPPPRPR